MITEKQYIEYKKAINEYESAVEENNTWQDLALGGWKLKAIMKLRKTDEMSRLSLADVKQYVENFMEANK